MIVRCDGTYVCMYACVRSWRVYVYVYVYVHMIDRVGKREKREKETVVMVMR